MTTNSITLDGIAEVLKKLDSLDKAVTKDINGTALFAASTVIKKEIESRAPKKRGQLAKSIKRKREHVNTLVREVIIYFGRKGSHAHLVEFGTAPHLLVQKGKAVIIGRSGNIVRGPIMHPGSTPHPFIRPAFDSKKEQAVRRYEKSIRAQVRKYTR